MSQFQHSFQVGGASASQFMVQAIGDEDEHQAGVAGFSERPLKMRNIVSVEVATLLKHRGEGALYVHGMEVGMVKVVGQVRNVDLRESSTAYQVEDRTGRIEVVQWHQGDEAPKPFQVEMLVSLVGELRWGVEQALVTAFKISPVSCQAEFDAHILEIAVLPVRLRKLQERAADLARAAFMGQDLTGVQSRNQLPQVQTAKVLPHKMQQVNSSGDWHSGLVTSGGSLNRGAQTHGAGVSRESLSRGAGPAGVSRGLGVGDQAWGAPAPVMSGEAVQLLSLIKNSQNPMGASRQELSRHRRTAGLEHLLEVLVQEGHIYTTCDQDHFMATDA